MYKYELKMLGQMLLFVAITAYANTYYIETEWNFLGVYCRLCHVD